MHAPAICTTLQESAERTPGIVHRLDKETSDALSSRKMMRPIGFIQTVPSAQSEKIYLALVAGKLRKQTGAIEEENPPASGPSTNE